MFTSVSGKEIKVASPMMEDVFMRGYQEWELYKEEETQEEPSNVVGIGEGEEPSNVINYLDAINELREERGC